MYLVEILLPMVAGPGDERIAQTRRELFEAFGGVTAFLRAPAEGETRDGKRAVHDDIVLVEVMVEAIDRAWWDGYRRSLEKRFGQKEIVIRATSFERL